MMLIKFFWWEYSTGLNIRHKEWRREKVMSKFANIILLITFYGLALQHISSSSLHFKDEILRIMLQDVLAISCFQTKFLELSIHKERLSAGRVWKSVFVGVLFPFIIVSRLALLELGSSNSAMYFFRPWFYEFPVSQLKNGIISI